MLQNKNIDLEKPAFGPGSQSIEDVEQPETPSVEEDQTIEEPEQDPSDPSAEETKVPYSRFEKFHKKALDAEARADALEAELATLKAQTEPHTDTDLPDYWVELYGDSAASAKAWRVQQKANDELREQARQEARDAVRQERYAEQHAMEENLSSIDDQFDSLTDAVGRDLTEKEQSALLDIVDEYTPKDVEGNYTGDLISFQKAWEIYELKKQHASVGRNQSRDSVASLTAANSQGDTSITEKDKNWNPLDWNAWKKRL